jgi:hypothetical protein
MSIDLNKMQLANYAADISNDQLRIASENNGLRVAFQANWFAVGHKFDSSVTKGLTRTMSLSSCTIDTPPASPDCQTLINKINDRFQKV